MVCRGFREGEASSKLTKIISVVVRDPHELHAKLQHPAASGNGSETEARFRVQDLYVISRIYMLNLSEHYGLQLHDNGTKSTETS